MNSFKNVWLKLLQELYSYAEDPNAIRKDAYVGLMLYSALIFVDVVIVRMVVWYHLVMLTNRLTMLFQRMTMMMMTRRKRMIILLKKKVMIPFKMCILLKINSWIFFIVYMFSFYILEFFLKFLLFCGFHFPHKNALSLSESLEGQIKKAKRLFYFRNRTIFPIVTSSIFKRR